MSVEESSGEDSNDSPYQPHTDPHSQFSPAVLSSLEHREGDSGDEGDIDDSPRREIVQISSDEEDETEDEDETEEQETEDEWADNEPEDGWDDVTLSDEENDNEEVATFEDVLSSDDDEKDGQTSEGLSKVVSLFACTRLLPPSSPSYDGHGHRHKKASAFLFVGLRLTPLWICFPPLTIPHKNIQMKKKRPPLSN